MVHDDDLKVRGQLYRCIRNQFEQLQDRRLILISQNVQ